MLLSKVITVGSTLVRVIQCSEILKRFAVANMKCLLWSRPLMQSESSWLLPNQLYHYYTISLLLCIYFQLVLGLRVQNKATLLLSKESDLTLEKSSRVWQSLQFHHCWWLNCSSPGDLSLSFLLPITINAQCCDI